MMPEEAAFLCRASPPLCTPVFVFILVVPHVSYRSLDEHRDLSGLSISAVESWVVMQGPKTKFHMTCVSAKSCYIACVRRADVVDPKL